MKRKHNFFVILSCVFIVCSPLLLQLYLQISSFEVMAREPIGDEAVMLLHTLQTADFSQLKGPYSRFGWSHPGPLLYYLVAPIYAYSDHHASSRAVGALLINLISLLLILFIGYRCGTNGDFLILCAALSLFLNYLDKAPSSLWGPFVTIIPFCAFMFILSTITLGKSLYIPVMAFYFSFLVQTHIMYLPICVFMIGSAIILRRINGKAKNSVESDRCGVKVWLTTLLVLSVLWIFPVVEQFSNEPGNLSLIYKHFTSRASDPSLEETVITVARHFSAAPLALFNKPGDRLKGAAQSSLSFINRTKYLLFFRPRWIFLEQNMM